MVNGRKLKTCPHCGQLIPPRPLFANAWIKQRIYDLVARSPQGISARAVFEQVWANDPDGGPESLNCIAVHVKQMVPILTRAGVAIRSTGGPYARYHLVKL